MPKAPTKNLKELEEEGEETENAIDETESTIAPGSTAPSCWSGTSSFEMIPGSGYTLGTPAPSTAGSEPCSGYELGTPAPTEASIGSGSWSICGSYHLGTPAPSEASNGSWIIASCTGYVLGTPAPSSSSSSSWDDCSAAGDSLGADIHSPTDYAVVATTSIANGSAQDSDSDAAPVASGVTTSSPTNPPIAMPSNRPPYQCELLIVQRSGPVLYLAMPNSSSTPTCSASTPSPTTSSALTTSSSLYQYDAQLAAAHASEIQVSLSAIPWLAPSQQEWTPPAAPHEPTPMEMSAWRELCAYLGGAALPPMTFFALFGRLSRDSIQEMFGSHICYGMLVLMLRHPQRHLCHRDPQGFMLFGWFAAPTRFGRLESRMPLGMYEGEHDGALIQWYPAIFDAMIDPQNPGWIKMWCKAILDRESRGWWVNVSRVFQWFNCGGTWPDAAYGRWDSLPNVPRAPRPIRDNPRP